MPGLGRGHILHLAYRLFQGGILIAVAGLVGGAGKSGLLVVAEAGLFL